MGCINYVSMYCSSHSSATTDVPDPQVPGGRAETTPLRPCNATDLAQGLQGTWRLSPFARGDQYGWDKAESERLRKADASEASERPVHEYLPDRCRLRRFDARDAIGRCFGGRRLAFLGDSLAEQVSKALLGMLGHAGHAATKTEHGDVFSMDKAPSKEEFVARPKKRHPRYWKQRDFGGGSESGMEVLERFKLGAWTSIDWRTSTNRKSGRAM